MKVVFRTDASLDIGTGHVMRCLTLAEALLERGADCRFICREHAGNLINLIRDRGFAIHPLPLADVRPVVLDAQRETLPIHAAWLGGDWAADAQQTKAGVGDTQVDWLIVDHYAIDAPWESVLRSVCGQLMVIDDLADRPHDCDLLLDQNLGRTVADYTDRVPDGCTVLIGPQYAILRPKFAALRPYSIARRTTPQLQQLLITMGGVDKDNATCQVLDALKDCSLPSDCRITVVMGPHAPHLNAVRNLAAEMLWPTQVLVNVRDMARLMADSDLAIGAAGSTSWERCALGLPSIIVVLAENQKSIAIALDSAGAARVMDLTTLKKEMNSFFYQAETIGSLLACISSAASGVTNGQGATLVSETLLRRGRPHENFVFV